MVQKSSLFPKIITGCLDINWLNRSGKYHTNSMMGPPPDEPLVGPLLIFWLFCQNILGFRLFVGFLKLTVITYSRYKYDWGAVLTTYMKFYGHVSWTAWSHSRYQVTWEAERVFSIKLYNFPTKFYLGSFFHPPWNPF